MRHESLTNGPVQERREIRAGQIDFDGDRLAFHERADAANGIEAIVEGSADFRADERHEAMATFASEGVRGAAGLSAAKRSAAE